MSLGMTNAVPEGSTFVREPQKENQNKVDGSSRAAERPHGDFLLVGEAASDGGAGVIGVMLAGNAITAFTMYWFYRFVQMRDALPRSVNRCHGRATSRGSVEICVMLLHT